MTTGDVAAYALIGIIAYVVVSLVTNWWDRE